MPDTPLAMRGRALPVTDVVRALRRYHYDREHRYGKQGCTVANVATLARLRPTTVKNARDYGYMSEDTRVMLSHAILLIESGRVKFHRARGPAKGQPRWTIEYRDPPARRPPPEDRLTRAVDHRDWARCRTCQGDRWTAVVCHGTLHFACNQCMGPGHWPAMGARAANAGELPNSQIREDFSFLLREE
jgi:hypothetical protein